MLQMKKILVLAVMFATIFSTCHADEVKISNLNAEQFLQSMRNVLYSKEIQEVFPFVTSDLVRGKNDLTEKNLTVWSTFFGKKGTENPDGEVTFYVDKDNCVNVVKITINENENSATEYSNVFASICKAIGLTDKEAFTLFSGGQSEEQGVYHSSVESGNKVFFVMTVLDNGVTRAIFMADEK